ncbi:TetR/AcrR family transcriptional regulator [Pendulispora rubella]|uniref:TetR/AcrR family transcriptional regulator n=2 Tax=Pendulispora rubella TaxID=2741070 RepID=A0ABZ2L5H3_9BACT
MFNRHGFEQVSIDDVMKHAGLTRGGFYNHFTSKDELYAEAVRSFTTCNPFAQRYAGSEARLPSPEQHARALVDLYLSDEALGDLDHHCPLIAVPSDVARAGLERRSSRSVGIALERVSRHSEVPRREKVRRSSRSARSELLTDPGFIRKVSSVVLMELRAGARSREDRRTIATLAKAPRLIALSCRHTGAQLLTANAAISKSSRALSIFRFRIV